MSLTRQDVAKVARLARLRLSDSELDTLTPQLARIVAYVEQLAELDTDGVEPLAHPGELSNVFADDEVKPSLDRSQALAASAKHDDECFRVPAVLGE
jgi:aspartyl-tRNA(Asn)/glutamyl-tRNA(Gln) amidotransferase subunit C